ncbi:kelch-like protein 30 [Branchiostoma floridae]|uniref:Kelch-like protein 30 n=1 Tax=Branchiostoma floridae TaxID=7739 RepID=A0A9J7LPB5_BRAFL|nr:kelch-like protein 30 [Branchiostoma floridae]XP_035685470.1 kelch-like protein 30 [Branchiostoma floridae]XP_035685471.1 kelch-like protein 30 [Branchiostoma floridae]
MPNYNNRCDSKQYHEDGSCTFENKNKSHDLRTELTRQRKNGEFVDVVVEVEGRQFPCHRAVLAVTPYFQTMFSSNLAESKAKVITLHDIDSGSFSKILDFVYTGEILIGKDDVQDILQAAHMLQVEGVLECCQRFIENNLCASNCVGVMHLADVYGLCDLKKTARRKAMFQISEVGRCEEFLSLSTQQLLDLLGDKELGVEKEDDVVLSVMRWLDHELESRKTEISRILPVLCLSRVRVSMLEKLEAHPAIQESPECLAKVTATKEGHFSGSPQLMADTGREEAGRKPSCWISDDLAIIIGGWKAVTKERYSQNPTPPVPLQSIICMDIDRDQCYHVTDIPTPIVGCISVTSAGRYLYMTGGRASSSLHPDPGGSNIPSKQAFRYDFATDTWKRLPDMPRGRAGHQSAVVDGKLYLVGGNTAATLFNMFSMECFDIEAEAWIQPPKVPAIIPSPNLKVIACGGKLVLIQGIKKKSRFCVHALDVKTQRWTYASRYVEAEDFDADFRATAVGNKVHFCVDMRMYSDVYNYDVDKETPSIEEKQNTQDVKKELHIVHAVCDRRKRYVKGQKGIINTISRKTYKLLVGQFRSFYNYGSGHTELILPFALFGHGFLATKKSRVGWFCRDQLATVEKEKELHDLLMYYYPSSDDDY